MAVQSLSLLAAATSLAPNTYHRPDPVQTPTGRGVPTGVTWYQLVIDVSQQTDPATHWEARVELSLDGGTTWQEAGGGGRDGGVGHDKAGNVITQAAIFTGQDALNPTNDPLPGAQLSSTLRRARASLVVTGTQTLGPIQIFVGGPSDSAPATS